MENQTEPRSVSGDLSDTPFVDVLYVVGKSGANAVVSLEQEDRSIEIVVWGGRLVEIFVKHQVKRPCVDGNDALVDAMTAVLASVLTARSGLFACSVTTTTQPLRDPSAGALSLKEGVNLVAELEALVCSGLVAEPTGTQ